MKYLLTGCLLLLASFNTHAQGYNGLIARWPFNGNANDVSGNNLHGTANGAVNSTGFNGVANTGMYFNGSSSVTVPYSPLMNVTEYSICAVVRPEVFHSGSCQGNIILWRGHNWWQGFYGMDINDNTIVNDCTVFDPAAEYCKIAFYNDGTLPFDTNWITPNPIQANTWYCLVGTYDGDTARVYVNGSLTNAVGYSSQLQAGTSGLSIGANVFHSQWPNWFTGKMDEVRLYNRVLSPAEAAMFCDSVTAIATAVVDVVTPDMVTIGPNPCYDRVVAYLPKTCSGSMQVFNTLGQAILARSFNSDANPAVDVKELPAGVYLLHLQVDGQTIVNRFIKE